MNENNEFTANQEQYLTLFREIRQISETQNTKRHLQNLRNSCCAKKNPEIRSLRNHKPKKDSLNFTRRGLLLGSEMWAEMTCEYPKHCLVRFNFYSLVSGFMSDESDL